MMQSSSPDLSSLPLQRPVIKAKQRIMIIAGIAIGIGIVIAAMQPQTSQGRYITEPLNRGSITAAVSATGTLQPTRSVSVGSEISGTLQTVLVEENDVVKEGQEMARLDLSKLNDTVTKARANLTAAEADVIGKTASLKQAQSYLNRLHKIADATQGKMPAAADLDTATANLETAQASVNSAKASVEQMRATLQSGETDVQKAVIRSPINGVVLTRDVEPGQTVTASMTTPVLFTLAEDLTKMELQVNVDEADVATLKMGQAATFTVSAWPKKVFPATIKRINIGSTTTDNVVTYTTILTVDNAEQLLRPGMTAVARIVVADRSNVLRVPTSALRFSPPTSSTQDQGNFIQKLLPRPPRQQKQVTNQVTPHTEQTIWIMDNNTPKPVSITVGASDGRYVEITGDNLTEGVDVITDYQSQSR